MPNYPGVVPAESFATDDHYYLADFLDGFSVDYWPPHETDPGPAFSNVVARQNPSAGPALRSVSAVRAPAYRDDYYERIHINPNPVDLGNLLSEQVRQVEVWNAYTNASQELASVTPANDGGIVMTEPVATPYTYRQLEFQVYDLNVSLDGPVTINATYTFDFPSEDPVLRVTGTRVIVFALPPNWSDPVNERLEWLTQIIEAEDGTEQAIGLRSVPRRSLEYRALAHRRDRRLMQSLLWDWQARAYRLPIWTDESRLTAAAAAGDTVISLDTTDRDFHAGGLAVLVQGMNMHEAVEIQSVSAGSLTLANALQSDWPDGARVYPGRLARLGDKQSLTAYTDELETMALSFAFDENASDLTPAELSPTTYRGYPVLELEPNWREDLTNDYQRRLAIFDNRTGRRSIDDVTGRARVLHDFLWTRTSRADIQALRRWLYARDGRRNPIWIDTHTNDLVLAETVADAATTVKVENIGYSLHAVGQIGRRDIVIVLKDGTRIYRRITAATEQDADIERLTIDASLGVTVAPGDVRRISYLLLARMASDAVVITWKTNELAECRHRMTGVANDV